jgi:hypothetical protein
MTQATIHAAAAFAEVPVEHMMSNDRRWRPVRARHLAAYVFRHRDKLSYPKIAKLMGRKDHSTVISSIWVVEKLMAEDALVAMWIAQELALPADRTFQTAEGKVIPPQGQKGPQIALQGPKQIADLFGVNVPAVSKHLSNIFEDGELDPSATVSKMETVRLEGGRQVTPAPWKPTPAPTLLKTVKVKNEPVFADKNARMILHGTFKLERALLQAMAERCQRGIAA